jgi:uncharacterized membrane protein (GlpM family)
MASEPHILLSAICSESSILCHPASLLALKMAFTATIVVAASVAVERSGPFIGALIAALPTAAAAAYIILGLEHSASFVSASAVGSLAANAAVAIFALVYAALAQRQGLLLSLGVALLFWFCAAAALRTFEWTALRALALNAVVYGATIALSAPYRRSARVPAFARRRYDLVLRAFTAAVVVAAVTTASHRIGSFASGVFAVFPIVMSSLAVVLHPRLGGKASAAVFAHAQPPLFGLALGFCAVHYLAEPLGVWWAYLAGLATAATWSGMLWLMRRTGGS